MSETKDSRQSVITYLLLVFAFSSLFYFLVLKAHTLGAGAGLYVMGLMWCPGLAAMATLKLGGRKLSELGWNWPTSKHAFQSWAIPLCYALVAYLIVWTFGFGGFPNREFMEQIGTRMGLRIPLWSSTALYVVLAGSFGLIRGLASALGEEIGWRGFLVPELFKKIGFTGAALISGIIWSCWHYPLLIWGDYNSGTPTWYGLTCFTVMVISLSFIFAWMRLKSGSLWTGALLHASHNLYIQAILTPLTRNTGKTAWYIDEFGAVLPVVTLLLAIYVWTKRKELPVVSA
ncbi:MAG: CPBP family intramembrane metalloprotease [Acidobacteria bacterium]|nr:CPBP family intramembrane metalloprotease [Acidobacteriota bacterium]MBS1867221.1 CPBP family intramembrane metalloprotease [Acidobacteriota bacterium]